MSDIRLLELVAEAYVEARASRARMGPDYDALLSLNETQERIQNQLIGMGILEPLDSSSPESDFEVDITPSPVFSPFTAHSPFLPPSPFTASRLVIKRRRFPILLRLKFPLRWITRLIKKFLRLLLRSRAKPPAGVSSISPVNPSPSAVKSYKSVSKLSDSVLSAPNGVTSCALPSRARKDSSSGWQAADASGDMCVSLSFNSNKNRALGSIREVEEPLQKIPSTTPVRPRVVSPN